MNALMVKKYVLFDRIVKAQYDNDETKNVRKKKL